MTKEECSKRCELLALKREEQDHKPRNFSELEKASGSSLQPPESKAEASLHLDSVPGRPMSDL